MKRFLIVFFLFQSVYLSSYNLTTWSSPQTISSSDVDASDFRIGMDSSGNVVAIWLENGILVSRSKLWNSSWDTLITLSNSTVSFSQIVVDSDGNATVVWIEGGLVKGAYKPFNGSWKDSSPPSSLISSSTQIAVDSSGNVVCIWIENGDVISSTKLAGGSWSARDTLSSSGGGSPQIAIGDNGAAVAVWQAIDINSVSRIYAASKTLPSGDWSTAFAISEATYDCAYPQIAIGVDGFTEALWYSYILKDGVYSRVVVESAYFPTADSSWSTPELISQVGCQDPANFKAQIFVENINCSAAIWNYQYNNSNFVVQASTKNSQSRWNSPFPITNNIFAYSMSLSGTRLGSLLVPYMGYDPKSSSITINVVEAYASGYYAGTWSTPITISSGNSNGFPDAASIVSADGLQAQAVIGWVNFNGKNNTIQSVNGQGDLIAPPSNLSVKQSSQNWGIFTEYFNTISWDSSNAPNLVGYMIYRNGFPVSYVAPANVSYTDYNQQQNGSIVYSVSCLGTSNSEGSLNSVSFP